MVRPILRLGDPRLLEPCRALGAADAELVRRLSGDLRDTLRDFRRRRGAGRGIAAPQIGESVRAIYLDWPEPALLVNPSLDRFSDDTFELWDDCMSFPDLLVRVRRHRSCRLRYEDEAGIQRSVMLEGAASELLQHEVDHLDGVLATSRAVDGHAFALRDEFERTAVEQGRGDETTTTGWSPLTIEAGRLSASNRAPCPRGR